MVATTWPKHKKNAHDFLWCSCSYICIASVLSAEANGKKLGTYPVNIDATLNYDSDFVLGEQEEERLIRQDLRRDAARLIVLRFKSVAK